MVKVNLVLILSHDNTFSFTCKWNSFLQEWLSCRPRFQKEAKGDSEMGYFCWDTTFSVFTPRRQNINAIRNATFSNFSNQLSNKNRNNTVNDSKIQILSELEFETPQFACWVFQWRLKVKFCLGLICRTTFSGTTCGSRTNWIRNNYNSWFFYTTEVYFSLLRIHLSQNYQCMKTYLLAELNERHSCVTNGNHMTHGWIISRIISSFF